MQVAAVLVELVHQDKVMPAVMRPQTLDKIKLSAAVVVVLVQQVAQAVVQTMHRVQVVMDPPAQLPAHLLHMQAAAVVLQVGSKGVFTLPEALAVEQQRRLMEQMARLIQVAVAVVVTTL
jgi:hypothetical protein